jgi:spermidine synthase
MLRGNRLNPMTTLNSWTPPRRSIVYALFALSGATSLAYEVVWTRLLIRVFGATSVAVTTVLASWMAGLALGSYLFGRLIDGPAQDRAARARSDLQHRWRHPVRIYGLLELGIGAFALVLPLVLIGLNGLYGAIYRASGGHYGLLGPARVGLGFAVLLIPTTLMGGTLPVLSRFVAGERAGLARRIGLLYAINTFGAVAGAFASGYLLLPGLGLSRTTWLCVALNVAIFAAAVLACRWPECANDSRAAQGEIEPGRRKKAAAAKSQVAAHAPARAPDDAIAAQVGDLGSRGRAVVLVAFMLTGFAALAAEVVWTRALALVIGTTVYAFSAMLATFLLGLAIGSAVFSRIADRTRRPRMTLGIVAAAIGVTVFLTSLAFGRLPVAYLGLGQRLGWGWAPMMWAQFLFCLLAMLAPTFLMGGTFPFVARIYVTDPARVGRGVGTAYAMNTVGSILGSFAGSFILLEYVGLERSLAVVAAIYLAVGLALILTVAEIGRPCRLRAAVGVAALVALVLAFAPRWDPRLMTSAVYRYAQTYKTGERLREHLKNKAILFYDDGPGATVTVERFRDELSLGIDGKADASTGLGDMTTQTMLAHLPLVFHPKPDTVLVIGLGCGMSLGSAERYPVKAIDCVELLDNVVRAARYFEEYNHKCLDDPRVNLIVADARNHVMLSRRTYDVIISEPTNPWIAGVGDLFTKEFFEAAGRRLKPDGIICSWFHTYQMGEDDLKAMVRTFLEVFPEVSMWMSNESDVIFLGSWRPLSFDRGMVERLAAPGVAADLKRIWVDDIVDVLGGYVWGRESLRLYGGPSTELHTDDNMLLEYSAARQVFKTLSTRHLATFAASTDMPPLGGMGADLAELIGARIQARRKAMQGTVELTSGRTARGIGLYDGAFAEAPGDPYVLSAYTACHLSMGQSLAARGEYSAAAEHYRKAAVEPAYPAAASGYDGLAACSARTGDLARARKFYRLSLDLNPYNRSTSYNLARLSMAAGDTASAIALYEKTAALFPGDADAVAGLARVYAARRENLDRALELARHAASAGGRAYHYNALGWVLCERGDLGGARRALKRALDLEPDNSETLYRLGLAEMASANTAQARARLESLARLGRKDEYTAKARELLRDMERH